MIICSFIRFWYEWILAIRNKGEIIFSSKNYSHYCNCWLKFWKNVLEEIRNSTSFPIFKEKIKKVPMISCSCNCCRKYSYHVGFIQLFYIFNWENLRVSCSPESRINITLHIQLCNNDKYSANYVFNSGQYEAGVNFY